MPSRVITNQALDQVLLNGLGQYLYVAAVGDLRWSGTTVISSGGQTSITNLGSIVSLIEGSGFEDAVRYTGGYASLTNEGFIGSSTGYGIAIRGGSNFDIVNNGSVFGAESAVSFMTPTQVSSVRIVNNGTLSGRVGVDTFSQGNLVVINTGTISGASFGIRGSSADVFIDVINSGRITGEFYAFSGGNRNDLYDGRLGLALGVVAGGDGNNTLMGGAGAETFEGGSGDDEILGGGGNDVIDGDGGGDLLDGGEGFDLVSLRASDTSMLVDLQNPALNTGDIADAALLNFEGVIGGFGADTLRGNTLGNDLRGGSNSDVIDGRAGNDTMRGGFGDDLMFVDAVGDRVIEGSSQGADTVIAALSYRLAPNAEVEVLATSDAAGTAAIVFTGSNTANQIRGNAGANRLVGLDGADTLLGFGGADILYGGTGADSLAGGDADDVLYGDADADRLDGGIGNDRLAGGDGNDFLTGGLGRDIFTFDTAVIYNPNPFIPLNRDVITDFNPVDDTMRLSLTVFAELGAAGPLPASAFLSVAGAQATQAGHRIIYDPTTGMVWYDFDGSAPGFATQIAILVNVPANVTAGDFAIIA